MKAFSHIGVLKWTVFQYLLLVSVLYFGKLTLIGGSVVGKYGVGYLVRFYLPKIMPIFLFTLFLGSEIYGLRRLRQTVNAVMMGLFYLSLVTLTAFCFGSVLQVPISTFLGFFQWSYTALITWNSIFVLGFLLMYWKTAKPFLSAVYATLTISAGGILYELPLYPIVPTSDIYFHHSYPLFVATKWFSLIFLCWIMYKMGWRQNFKTFIAIWFYIMFSVVYILFPTQVLPVWLPRLPTAIMLLTLPFGLKGRK